MNVHVILIAYALDPVPLLKSIWTSDLTLHLFLHSRREGVALACRRFADEYPNVNYYDYGINRGLGKSVNEGVIAARQENAHATLVLNDDLTMRKSDLYLLAEGAMDHPECGLVFANGWDAKRIHRHNRLEFSAFALNPSALDRVGYFDENLPDYFCDCDYRYRCTLAGVEHHHVDTNIVHTGSGTLAAVPELQEQLQRTFPADGEYFRAKWGGVPYMETFKHPWNDPAWSHFIAADTRHDPYPAHRRPDAELARI